MAWHAMGFLQHAAPLLRPAALTEQQRGWVGVQGGTGPRVRDLGRAVLPAEEPNARQACLPAFDALGGACAGSLPTPLWSPNHWSP
jgi:hypothetical protein